MCMIPKYIWTAYTVSTVEHLQEEQEAKLLACTYAEWIWIINAPQFVNKQKRKLEISRN